MTLKKYINYLPATDIIFAWVKVQSLIYSGASVTLLELSVFKKQHNPEIEVSNIDVNITLISGDNLDVSIFLL